jgi:hypothetical protein
MGTGLPFSTFQRLIIRTMPFHSPPNALFGQQYS